MSSLFDGNNSRSAAEQGIVALRGVNSEDVGTMKKLYQEGIASYRKVYKNREMGNEGQER